MKNIKLKNIPIISMTVEMKFKVNIPDDAVFGLLYPFLSNEYRNFNQFPIQQIPIDIQKRDINLFYAPHYEFYDENKPLKVLIGPRVLIVSFLKNSSNNYPGWRDYIETETLKIFENIFKLNFIKSIERFGIRYIDFFEDLNIFEHVQFKILNKDDTSIAQEEKLQILRNFQKNDFFHNITISNNANVFIENIKKEGSIIDIDTFKENYEIDNFIKNYKNYIKIAHDINKQEFFENLNSDFIKNLQEG